MVVGEVFGSVDPVAVDRYDDVAADSYWPPSVLLR